MTAQTQTEHDPVCHMDITIAAAAGRSEFEGHTYYFCSPGCKREFDLDPAGVLTRDAEYDHSQGPDEEAMGMSAARPAKRPFWQFWKK